MTGPIRICALCLATAALTALVLAGPALAGDKPRPGPEAGIWREVQSLLAKGEEMKACKRAVDLNKYPDTPTYAQAQQELEAIGISLENPEGSCTVKQIIALQNACEAERAASGMVPNPGPRSKYLDAWGRPIRVEIIARKGFLYSVRSAGRDGIWLSDDDLVIGVREDTKAQAAPKMDDPGRARGRSSLYKRGGMGASVTTAPGGGSGSGSSTAGKKSSPKQSGEVEVTLDELLKK